MATIIIIVVLAGWHLRTRRHPGWQVSADARFYISLGYPMVAIAAYWLLDSPTNTHWEWALGNAWALVAMVMFVLGFAALNDVPKQQQAASQSIEAIRPDADIPAAPPAPDPSAAELSRREFAPSEHPGNGDR